MSMTDYSDLYRGNSNQVTKSSSKNQPSPSTLGGNTLGMPAPTARMQACGGLITAVKELMPNIPEEQEKLRGEMR